MLLTGKAGTGKSYVIKSAFKHLRETGNNVALTFSTGLATTVYENVGACTLHKWSVISDGQYANNEILYLIQSDERYEKLKENILKCNYLFTDEISMISTKTLGQVEFICKGLRNRNSFFRRLHSYP